MARKSNCPGTLFVYESPALSMFRMTYSERCIRDNNGLNVENLPALSRLTKGSHLSRGFPVRYNYIASIVDR